MARWDPGAEERLKRAALELYLEHGYDSVTVTDIAERAGLTRRSYFRYFPDKREVLFAGSERLAPRWRKRLWRWTRTRPRSPPSSKGSRWSAPNSSNWSTARASAGR
ncbi:helix-turn-helix domain-containing protein [Streptomyces sp. M19]